MRVRVPLLAPLGMRVGCAHLLLALPLALSVSTAAACAHPSLPVSRLSAGRAVLVDAGGVRFECRLSPTAHLFWLLERLTVDGGDEVVSRRFRERSERPLAGSHAPDAESDRLALASFAAVRDRYLEGFVALRLFPEAVGAALMGVLAVREGEHPHDPISPAYLARDPQLDAFARALYPEVRAAMRGGGTLAALGRRLLPALRRALAALERGQAAVLDVVLERP